MVMKLPLECMKPATAALQLNNSWIAHPLT